MAVSVLTTRNNGVIDMFRKTMLALTAAALVGGAALVPGAASAKPFGFHHGWHGFGFVGGPVYDSCLAQEWVRTPYGLRLRWVNVCY